MSIDILYCGSLESILGQDDREFQSLQHFDTASSSECRSDLASRISPFPCLTSVMLYDCKKLRFMSAQLDSLLSLCISCCNGLELLDCLGDLPLLKTLHLFGCKHLVSLPGSPGNYSALQKLTIRYCPAINMKPLYGHIKQRLDRLKYRIYLMLVRVILMKDLNYGNPNLGNMLFLDAARMLTLMTE